MKKLLTIVGLMVLAGAFAACGSDSDGGGGAGATGGSGGSGGTGGTGGTVITVSGQVMLNPLAQAFYAATSQTPPPVEGLTVFLRRINADTSRTDLGTGTAAADGTFSVANVDVTDPGLGIVATVDDDPGDVFVPATMAICQAAACQVDLQTPVFAFPTAVNAALQTALANQDLLANGYVLGLALDVSNPAAPTPMGGVTINAAGATIIYLSPLLTDSGGTLTVDNVGAFVISQVTSPITNLTPEKANVTFTPAAQPVGVSAGVVFQVFFKGTPTA